MKNEYAKWISMDRMVVRDPPTQEEVNKWFKIVEQFRIQRKANDIIDTLAKEPACQNLF